MKAISRLYQYFEFKDIRPTRFEKEIGLGNGYLSLQSRRDADIGSSIVEKIADNARDLNIEWLMTGNGNMIREIRPDQPGENIIPELQTLDTAPAGCEKCIIKDKLINSLQSQVELQAKFIIHLEKNIPTV